MRAGWLWGWWGARAQRMTVLSVPCTHGFKSRHHRHRHPPGRRVRRLTIGALNRMEGLLGSVVNSRAPMPGGGEEVTVSISKGGEEAHVPIGGTKQHGNTGGVVWTHDGAALTSLREHLPTRRVGYGEGGQRDASFFRCVQEGWWKVGVRCESCAATSSGMGGGPKD